VKIWEVTKSDFCFYIFHSGCCTGINYVAWWWAREGRCRRCENKELIKIAMGHRKDESRMNGLEWKDGRMWLDS
jgi:hypothetical protein